MKVRTFSAAEVRKSYREEYFEWREKKKDRSDTAKGDFMGFTVLGLQRLSSGVSQMVLADFGLRFSPKCSWNRDDSSSKASWTVLIP